MSAAETAPASTAGPLPRVAIRYCIQCKWMLRAAYLAQELLSTFGLSLGEVALQPAGGGDFTISVQLDRQPVLVWDRRIDGGFPEAKELKRRVRDLIDPTRDLGHVDRQSRPAVPAQAPPPDCDEGCDIQGQPPRTGAPAAR